MIFQEPMTALNPLYTVGEQIAETIAAARRRVGRTRRASAAIELLARTGIPEPEQRIDSYPHQLSGGQRQRAMIAMALACRPRLLLADEPTTALDVTMRAQIVELLLELQRDEAAKRGMAVLLITHDLNLVRRFAQRVAVMEKGVLVESGTVEADFRSRRSIRIRSVCWQSGPQRAVVPVLPIVAGAARRAGTCRSITRRSCRASAAGFGAARSARSHDVDRIGAAGRDAGHRRRIGFGQIDARDGAARPAAHRRTARSSFRAGRSASYRGREQTALALEHAGGVSGPVQFAVAAADDRADRRRRARAASAGSDAAARHAQGGVGAARSRHGPHGAATAIRTSFPAASASGSRLRARWCSSRAF